MLRDYQRLFMDSIINDIDDLFCCYMDEHIDESMKEAMQIALESRIETYDRERKEQIERDLPAAIARAMSDVL